MRALNIGPSGQATKLQTLITAIDFVLSRIPESGASEEDRELAYSAAMTRHKVQRWKRSINQEKLAYAVRKKEYINENLQSPVEVDTFLNSDVVRRKMEELADGEEAEESSLKRYKRNKE